MARRLEPRSSASTDLTRGEVVVYLALAVAGALAVRAAFSYTLVLTPGGINFQDNDSWYHARAVEHLVANWPHPLRGDPYAVSGGQTVPLAPLLDFIAASAALIVGLGHPSARTVEIVAAWTPAVLGALIPVPVFLVTRRLLDARAALMAAALTAVFPGHLLERSRLGYLDHHVLEALLAMTTLWLVIKALQAPAIRGQAAGGAIAGLALGAYLLSWTTGSYIVGILVVWAAVHYAAAAALRRGDAAPGVVLGTSALAAIAVVLAFQNPAMYRYDFQVASLTVAIGVAAGLEALRRGLAALKLSERWFPAAAILLAAAAFLFAERVFPVVGGLRGEVMRAAPDPSAYTVVEAMPLHAYVFAPWIRVKPYMVLGTGLPLGLLGLAFFIALTIRDARPERTLVLVWTLVTLVSTLLRNRFAYYLAPMLAVLGGWICARALLWLENRPRLHDLAIVLIGALAFAPNLWPAREQARVDLGVPPGWQQAMDWLRTKTPEPFGDPNFYFAAYSNPLPEPAYSVMVWWDYGYWVMRRGRRVPVANPTQVGASVAAAFFVENDPAKAAALLRSLKARYVVIDYQLPLRIVPAPTYAMGKFEDLVIWAGRKPGDFYEGMVVKDDRGNLRPALVFHPAYYRAMLNRLYQFDGRRVAPASSSVITYVDSHAPDGTAIREITALRTFRSFHEADAYLTSLGPGNHRLVGLDPAESPVPLEDLPDYYRVFDSPERGPWRSRGTVGVFQFTE